MCKEFVNVGKKRRRGNNSYKEKQDLDAKRLKYIQPAIKIYSMSYLAHHTTPCNNETLL